MPLGFGADGKQGTDDDSTLPEGSFTEQKFYDTKGRLDYEISFEGVVTKYVYDDSIGAGGRLAQKKFFPNSDAYSGGSGTPSDVWTYTYGAFGREYQVSQQVAGVTRTTTTHYDAEGRIAQIVSPEGTLNYAYNPVTGLRERVFTGTAADPIDDTHYTYDASGRLATVEVYERNNVPIPDTDASTAGYQGETTRYAYDLMGNLRTERKANGVVADYVYDNLNRLDVLTEFQDADNDGVCDPGEQKLTQFDYTVRADGKRTAATESFWFDDNEDSIAELHTNNITWSYDNVGRLINEVIDHYDPALDQTEHFVYDLVGNRTQQTLDKGNNGSVEETTDSVYDVNDRLITESLDTNGESGYERVTTHGYERTQETLKQVTAPGVPQSKAEYTYDLQGRMHTAKVTTYTSGAPSRIERSTYAYDASGIRVSALVEIDANADQTYETVTKTEYLNDPANQTGYSQVLTETTTDVTTSQVQKRVEYTLGHDRISQTTTTYSGGQPQSSETLFFGQDGHGSTRVLFGAAGAIATVAGARQLFHYDAFGNAIGFDAALAATLFLYSGEQTDRTGLQYLRARYYDPASGRFNSLDPFVGNSEDPQSLHKYLYCHADPVLGVDPTGLVFGTLARYGISIKNSLTALAAIDRLQNAVEIGQVVLQLALTGTVNPLDVAEIALNIMPGAAMFKRLKMYIPPFRRTTSMTSVMTGASEFLTGMARHTGIDKLGRDIYKNVNGNWAKFDAVWTRYVEKVGELGGGLVAKRMGLNKVESYVKRGIHGFDGIYKKGNKYFILEAKGGISDLAKGQMSQKWIAENIRKLDDPLRSQLKKAFDNGNLFGIVTKTPIDKVTGEVLNPSYTIKNITQIGKAF